MNILLIGNGFDVAHGLPTKYEHFLDYVESPDNPKSKEMQENIWIDGFLKRKSDLGDNWIDLESEISSIIKRFERLYLVQNFKDVFDNGYSFLDNFLLEEKVDKNSGEHINHRAKQIHDYDFGNKKSFIVFLHTQLLELINYLEIYLTVVSDLDVAHKSPDINELQIDKLLTFNYTDTFQKLYDMKNEVEYDYIHGKIGHTPNNIVLGIDEYLIGPDKNENLDFVQFKKYFQRIHKRTGCTYLKWIEELQRNFHLQTKVLSQVDGYVPDKAVQTNQLYIFGHSLDITDKDILSEIILQDGITTTIFYHNEESYAEKITNLIKVIGQDNLIRFVHSSNPKIKFQLQQDMIPAPVPATK